MTRRAKSWTYLLAAAAVATFIIQPATAAGGVGGRDATVLRFTPDSGLVMEAETVRIAAEDIAVVYVLRNTGAGDAATVVSLTLNGDDVSDGARHPNVPNCRNRIDLKASVDGVAPDVAIATVAMYQEKDVSKVLAGYGLDVSAPQSCDLRALGTKTLKAMQKAGLIDLELRPGEDPYIEQFWSETTTISWRQVIPAGASVTINTVQENYPWETDMALDHACVYPTAPASSGGLVKGMTYDLGAGGGLEGTVGRFRLTIDAGSGINRSCYAAGDKTPGATVLHVKSRTVVSVEKTDFAPLGTVSVLFDQRSDAN